MGPVEAVDIRLRQDETPAVKADVWTPVVVGLLACLISSVSLTRVSMSFDESATVTAASRSIDDLWRMIHNIDAVHALYDLMLHPVIAWFAVSELSVRLPSVVAVGVATAGVTVLGRQLVTREAALVAGLVFAVLPRVTWMGIEGRSFAATAAIAVWQTIIFVALLRRPSLVKHLGYAVLATLACSLNIFLVLLVAAHGCCLLLEPHLRFTRRFWTWLAAGTLGAAGGLPVLVMSVSQSGQIGAAGLDLVGYTRSVLVNQWFLGDTPTVFLSGGGGVAEGAGSGLWKPAAVLLAALCISLVLVAVLARQPRSWPGTPSSKTLLGAWLVVPTGAVVAYALLVSPIYNPRYLTFCTPAVALLVGIGLVRLRDLPGRLALAPLAAAASILLLTLPVYVSQRGTYAKSGADWKMVAQFVEQHPGAARAVYFAPRTPPTSDLVRLTSRTAMTLYPAAFTGVRDLTLVSSAAAEADLVGRDQPLSASVDRLVGVDQVFVVNRVDYPTDLVAADEAVLAGAGFGSVESWTGPLNSIVLYRR